MPWALVLQGCDCTFLDHRACHDVGYAINNRLFVLFSAFSRQVVSPNTYMENQQFHMEVVVV
jgi:hypothetical protein